MSHPLHLGDAPSSPCQLFLPPPLPIQSLASGPCESWHPMRNVSAGVLPGHEFLVTLKVFLFHRNHFERVPPVGLPHHLAPIFRKVNRGTRFPFINLGKVCIVPQESVASGKELVVYDIVGAITMQFTIQAKDC